MRMGGRDAGNRGEKDSEENQRGVSESQTLVRLVQVHGVRGCFEVFGRCRLPGPFLPFPFCPLSLRHVTALCAVTLWAKVRDKRLSLSASESAQSTEKRRPRRQNTTDLTIAQQKQQLRGRRGHEDADATAPAGIAEMP